MSDPRDYHGSLVAFEGPPEIISTQLRLLPTSPQILILPSIQNYIRPASPPDPGPADPRHDHGESRPVSARSYIRRVHDAAALRNETALAFLRESSSSSSKRLVFTNGGTPSAQALCVRFIARNETDGDLALAEAAFRDLVRGGAAGLDKDEDLTPVAMTPAYEELEDPITRAMRAADRLDRLTAALQTSPHSLDVVAPRGRPRSLSLPLYGFADQFGDAVPFYVFGAPKESNNGNGDREPEEELDKLDLPPWLTRPPQAPPLLPPLVEVSSYGDRARERTAAAEENKGLLEQINLALRSNNAGLCTASEEHQHQHRPLSVFSNQDSEPRPSPLSDVFTIPDRVIYGKASLIELPRPGRARMRRAMSLDEIAPASPKRRRNFRFVVPPPPREDLDERGAEPPQSPMPFPNLPPGGVRAFSSSNLSSSCLSSSPEQTTGRVQVPARPSYVDRGTDAEDMTRPAPVSRPLFPFVENLVIYFRDDAPDVLLRSIIQSFKDGVYPVQAVPATAAGNGYRTGLGPLPCPGSGPQRNRACGPGPTHDHQQPSALPSPPGPDEYDPFAYHQKTTPTWTAPKKTRPQPLLGSTAAAAAAKIAKGPFVNPGPPTPAQTPPSPPALPGREEERFHDFDVGGSPTAVQVHNTLRSVLNIYFPSPGSAAGKDGCYHQFSFPLLLPELGGLWMPIFREAEPGSGKRKDNRKTDMIMAVGAHPGVAKDFFAGIVTRLERLGTKTNGARRSGRLDFRYLIANAMQAFTAQPLAHQTHDNPFTNSYLLATLIIPCLETYLAAHSEVRFLLLEYPPDHLPTVLALQRLVGVDVLKVTQVVDSNAEQPLPFNHLRGGSISGRPADASSASSPTASTTPSGSSASRIIMTGSGGGGGSAHRHNRSVPQTPALPPPENLKISDANYLLTASASEAEISTFISTIWKILMDISPFYVPGQRQLATKTADLPLSLSPSSPSLSSSAPTTATSNTSTASTRTAAIRRPKNPPSTRSRPTLAASLSPFPRVPSGSYSPPLSSPPLSPPNHHGNGNHNDSLGSSRHGRRSPTPGLVTCSSSYSSSSSSASSPILSSPTHPLLIPARSASLLDETLTVHSGRSLGLTLGGHHSGNGHVPVSRPGSCKPPGSNAGSRWGSSTTAAVTVGGSGESGRGDAASSSSLAGSDVDPESSDGEPDMDADERRFIPMFIKRPSLGNRSKALKLLGLP